MRIITIFLMILTFTATSVSAKQPVVGFVTGASGLGDMSFNDMSYGGVRKAQQEFNFKLIILGPGENGESTEAEFEKLIKQSDFLILVGAQHTSLVEKASARYPDKKFILLEVPINDHNNVSSVEFMQAEGSFLAGALAAFMSQTGQIGFIGATPIPPVKEFERGYIQGAKHAVPNIKVTVDYLSPLGDFSGFEVPDKSYVVAMNQFEDNADTIFTVAGLSGNGVIEAARRSGKFAIGVDSDQDSLAKGTVLTSMIKKLDVACYNELKAAMQGNFTAGPSRYGLSENGVGLSKMLYTRDMIPDEVIAKIEKFKQDIIDGKIIVN